MPAQERPIKDDNPLAKHPSERLRVILSNYVVGLNFLGALADSSLKERILSSTVAITCDGIDFIPPNTRKHYPEGMTVYTPEIHWGKDKNVNHLILEFNKMLIRVTTNDAHDALFQYCKQKGQTAFDELKRQDWFAFCHIIRNSLTHGQIFQFKQSHKKWLPASWNGKTIEESMDGDVPPFTIYDNFAAIELLNAMAEYSRTI